MARILPLSALLLIAVTSSSAFTCLPSRRAIATISSPRFMAEDGKDEEDMYEDYSVKSNDAVAERLRQTIRDRSEALGIEGETESAEAILAAENRARESLDRGLGLNEITYGYGGDSTGGADNNVLDMFDDGSDGLTEEEMRQADELGQRPFLEQLLVELVTISKPSVPEAIFKGFAVVFFIVLYQYCIFVFDQNVFAAMQSNGFYEGYELATDVGEYIRPIVSDAPNVDLGLPGLDLPGL